MSFSPRCFPILPSPYSLKHPTDAGTGQVMTQPLLPWSWRQEDSPDRLSQAQPPGSIGFPEEAAGTYREIGADLVGDKARGARGKVLADESESIGVGRAGRQPVWCPHVSEEGVSSP